MSSTRIVTCPAGADAACKIFPVGCAKAVVEASVDTTATRKPSAITARSRRTALSVHVRRLLSIRCTRTPPTPTSRKVLKDTDNLSVRFHRKMTPKKDKVSQAVTYGPRLPPISAKTAYRQGLPAQAVPQRVGRRRPCAAPVSSVKSIVTSLRCSGMVFILRASLVQCKQHTTSLPRVSRTSDNRHAGRRICRVLSVACNVEYRGEPRAMRTPDRSFPRKERRREC